MVVPVSLRLAGLILVPSLASAALGAELRGRVAASGVRGLEELVVELVEGAGLPALAPGARASMNQVRRQFSPRVVAVRAGDSVRFDNLDDVFHNVFSLDRRNPFDLGLYKGKKRFAEDRRAPDEAGEPAVRFSAAGVYPVFCNIHPDMSGLVYVFDHGYFARVDKDGLFLLPVPESGRVTLRVAGAPLAAPVERAVALPHEGVLEVPVKLKRLRLDAPHSRKDGSEYGGAYGGRP